MNKGFTLIELLVVVLIIGILSAIALPQYTRAVEKSRATQAVISAKAISDAARVYDLTYRKCPSALSDLDVKVEENVKGWYFGVNQQGARNCSAVVSFDAGEAYYTFYNGNPGGLTKGAAYWNCQGGTCDEFFKNINVKEVSSGYYQ